jgi:4-hydroxy-2-oxoheptanedioate aldolase
MTMRSNKLRQLLDAGQPTIGTHVLTPSPNVVEMLGHTGLFDYVEFSAEYASFDLHDLDNFCRAAELYGLSTLIKVDQDGQRFLAQRAVGSGFQGVLFADTRTVAEAQACVRAVRPETPGSDGWHGVGVRRITYGASAGSPEYVQALKDVVIALMIEKGSAVEHLEEIMAVPGMDMVNFGPSDYSMSVGRAAPYSQVRQDAHVRAVERKMIESALKHGVTPRAEIESPDEARYYLDLGVRHFCLGVDLFILKSWWQNNGEILRKMVGA